MVFEFAPTPVDLYKATSGHTAEGNSDIEQSGKAFLVHSTEDKKHNVSPSKRI